MEDEIKDLRERLTSLEGYTKYLENRIYLLEIRPPAVQYLPQYTPYINGLGVNGLTYSTSPVSTTSVPYLGGP
jgi:hypothetical protein